MKTHTIRNKASATPILTLSPAFWAHAKATAFPESVSLMLGWLRKEYKALTGKSLVLTHEQDQDFRQWVGADERGMWTSRFSNKPPKVYQIIRMFETGFLSNSSMSLEEALELAQEFYATIEKAYPT